MAAGRPDWKGAIEFAGFPVQVCAYKTAIPAKSPLRTLDPKYKQPIRSPYVDVKGTEVRRDQCLRGIEKSAGSFAEVKTTRTERTTVARIAYLAPVGSIPAHLALDTFNLVPDVKAAGAESSWQVLWGILDASGYAAVIPDWAPRADAYPHVLVVFAAGEGLRGSVMPYAHETRQAPAVTPQPSEEAAVIGAQLDRFYKVRPFDIASLSDSHLERLSAAIDDATVDGTVPVVEEPGAAVIDLMTALQASVKAAKPSAKRRKKAAA